MLALVVAFFFLFVLLQLYKYWKWYHSDFVKTINLIPGPPMVPVFGVAASLPREIGALTELLQVTWTKLYGRVYRLWIWSSPIVVVSSPSAMETVLTSQKLINKADSYDFLDEWLGPGLLLASGNKWRRNRRLLTPAFHFQILESFFEAFNRNAIILCEKLSADTESMSNNRQGTEIDVFPYLKRCALDIICEAAMGMSINSQSQDSQSTSNVHSQYITAVHRISEILAFKFLSLWQFFPNWMYRMSRQGSEYYRHLNLMHDFTSEVIQNRKALRQQEKHQNYRDDHIDADVGLKKRRAFLDLLLIEAENGADFTDLEIRNEVDTFMFEGHDTTSGAMVWFLYCMGTHPMEQDKVFQEIDEVLGESDRPCSMEDAANLKYLDCCIKEALRLYPSVPTIERQASEDVELDGYKVPQGSTISMQIYALHRNEEFFPDCLAFKPERFQNDQNSGRHPYVFVPFSAGPRNCIGQRFALLEEKVILATLLRRFRFTYDSARRGPPTVSSELILKPKHGMPLIVSQRR